MKKHVCFVNRFKREGIYKHFLSHGVDSLVRLPVTDIVKVDRYFCGST